MYRVRNIAAAVVVPSPLAGEAIAAFAGERMGERLSLVSSALPFFVVLDHGVEDGEKLSHDSGEGEFLGLS
jgi:hypothetical protein